MAYEDPIPALKRQLAETIVETARTWSLGDAAAQMSTDRWRVADIRAGRLQRFSLETLIRFAAHAGLAITITAEPRRRKVVGKKDRATG